MSTPDREPNLDPLAPYPAVAAAAASLNNHDWPSFRAQFIELDWIARSLAVVAAPASPELEAFVRSVAEQQPDDVLPATVLAHILTVIGWDIRTSKRAGDVSSEQFNQFHDCLRRAERLLVDVVARDPNMIVAWHLRLTTARGLQLGHSEARRRYDELSRRHPHHMPAQQQFLQQICKKWGGSFEKAHAFGRECSAGAPEGSLSPVIVAEDVIEHWLDLRDPESTRYVQSPQVQAELREAADRSVFHPSFQRTPGWVRVMSTFACAFSLANLYPAAASCFRALGPYGHASGWDYLKGGAQAAFVRHRTRAYQEQS
jgi:hypothetical protein